jgi:hypothetical protein
MIGDGYSSGRFRNLSEWYSENSSVIRETQPSSRTILLFQGLHFIYIHTDEVEDQGIRLAPTRPNHHSHNSPYYRS